MGGSVARRDTRTHRRCVGRGWDRHARPAAHGAGIGRAHDHPSGRVVVRTAARRPAGRRTRSVVGAAHAAGRLASTTAAARSHRGITGGADGRDPSHRSPRVGWTARTRACGGRCADRSAAGRAAAVVRRAVAVAAGRRSAGHPGRARDRRARVVGPDGLDVVGVTRGCGVVGRGCTVVIRVGVPQGSGDVQLGGPRGVGVTLGCGVVGRGWAVGFVRIGGLAGSGGVRFRGSRGVVGCGCAVDVLGASDIVGHRRCRGGFVPGAFGPGRRASGCGCRADVVPRGRSRVRSAAPRGCGALGGGRDRTALLAAPRHVGRTGCGRCRGRGVVGARIVDGSRAGGCRGCGVAGFGAGG